MSKQIYFGEQEEGGDPKTYYELSELIGQQGST